MADPFAKSETARRLSDVPDGEQSRSVQDSLVLIRRLALQVRALHEQGRTHRAIGAETVSVDEQLRPDLSPPARLQHFGINDADPEFCPPELAKADGFELPDDIEAAAAVLQQRGYAIHPRHVDIYQLGTLLCRLLTGEPIQGYMYSPNVKARVPPIARSILQRALGYDADDRFENCDALIEALDEVIREAEAAKPPTSLQETPAEGSVLWTSGDTPAQGSEAISATQPGCNLPFERLGHYRIIARIGGGGMGDVYQGYDESLGRRVAIKVLPPDLARDEDYVRRFHNEASAVAKIVHPNVVPVYYSGEDRGRHFFSMKFIEGESLSQRLARRRRLPSLACGRGAGGEGTPGWRRASTARRATAHGRTGAGHRSAGTPRAGAHRPLAAVKGLRRHYVPPS